MTDLATEPPRDLEFPIAFQEFAGSAGSLDFKGKGLLTVRTTPPGYVFRGKKRALFAGPPFDLEFGEAEIWNVVVTGRSISFHTLRGEAGQKHQPFVFFCRNAVEAGTVAALLPARKDEEFTATRDYLDRLNALAGRRRPWASVTNIIIALNVLAFVVMGCLGAGWFTVDSMRPYILYAANNGGATTDGEWWRLVTSMFVHYGLLHLVFNMWALYQAGHFLEKLLGRRLYALTYLGSGLAGGFLSIAWHGDQTWSAGASGAVFGVYGAILGYLVREKQSLPSGIYQPMLKSTLTFAGYNIVYGLRAGVDNSAHIGGVLGGLVLGWLLALPAEAEVRRQQARRKLQLGLGVVAALIVAGVLLTPRFAYSIRDEIAWDQAFSGFAARENDLLQRHQKAMAGLQPGTDPTAHAGWMAAELVPFYEGWDRRITSLTLQAGRLTARRRDALHNIFTARVAAYRRLLDGWHTHDPEAVAQYYQDEATVMAAIEKLRKP